MKPFDEVKPYPKGTVVYTADNTAAMWVKAESGWFRVSTVWGRSEPSSFTDEHVFCGERGWGYIVVLPPEPVLFKIREVEARKRVEAVNEAVSAFQRHIALYIAEDGCKACKTAYKVGNTIEEVSAGCCPEGRKLYDLAQKLQNS